MTTPLVPIDVALRDRNLLGAGLGDLASWSTWISVLKAAYGLELSDDERAAFDLVAGGRAPPTKRVRELVALASRRSGKGRMAAALACHAALMIDYRSILAPGEVPVVACISPTRAQSEILIDYIRGYLEASELLRGEVLSIGSDEIALRNGAVIAVLAGDFRSLRGRTLALGLVDEVAFLRDERSTRPDIEIVRGLSPGLVTTGGLLVLLSSPYRRSGLLYERHRQYFGKDDPSVLCVAGSSRTFNPTLDEAVIAQATANDPLAATSEWQGLFRQDLAAFIDPALIESAVDRSVVVRPRVPNVKYHAFADPSGGVSDSFTLGIAHQEGNGETVLDALIEREPPFRPTEVVQEMCAVLNEYGLREVKGDRYSAAWCVEGFAKHGVQYLHHDKDRSAIYLDTLPLLASGKVRLIDNAKLASQFAQLERRTGTQGRDRVDHPSGLHDDLANSAAGAIVLAAFADRYTGSTMRWGSYASGFIHLYDPASDPSNSNNPNPQSEPCRIKLEVPKRPITNNAGDGFTPNQTWRG